MSSITEENVAILALLVIVRDNLQLIASSTPMSPVIADHLDQLVADINGYDDGRFADVEMVMDISAKLAGWNTAYLNWVQDPYNREKAFYDACEELHFATQWTP